MSALSISNKWNHTLFVILQVTYLTYLSVCMCASGEQTQGPVNVKQAHKHWATYSAFVLVSGLSSVP